MFGFFGAEAGAADRRVVARIAVGLLLLLLFSLLPERPRTGAPNSASAPSPPTAVSFSRWQQLELQTRVAAWSGAIPSALLTQWADLASGGDRRVLRRALAVYAAAGETLPRSLGKLLIIPDGKPVIPIDERTWWTELLASPPTRPVAPIPKALASELPGWLRAGVDARLASNAGDDDRARAARTRQARQAGGSLAPLLAWMSIPTVLGMPLLLWTLVAGSGRGRRVWVMATVALVVALSAWGGVTASKETGSVIAGALVAVALLGIGSVVVALVGVAARVGKPWLKALPGPGDDAGVIPWLVVAECLVFYLVAYLGAQLAVGWLTEGTRARTFGVAAAQLSSGFAAVVFTLRRLEQAGVAREAIGIVGGHWPGHLWAGFAGWAMLSPVVALLGWVSHRLLESQVGLPPNPVLPLMTRPDPVVRAVLLAIAVFGAPLFEEFFFRGVLFSGLRSRLGGAKAALFSGLMFALLHPVVDWLPIFGLSAGLCWLRARRSSLVPAMIAHLLQNGTASLATLILFG